MALTVPAEGIPLANLLKEAGLTASTSDAHRMIKQGAVKIDGDRVEPGKQLISAPSEHLYQVGKRRFCRVTVS